MRPQRISRRPPATQAAAPRAKLDLLPGSLLMSCVLGAKSSPATSRCSRGCRHLIVNQTRVDKAAYNDRRMNEPDVILDMLGGPAREPRTLAVIGLSGDPAKPSFYVSEYMQ